MEKLKQYVNDGKVQIAKLDDKNTAQKIPFSQFEGEVTRQQKNAQIYKSLQHLTWDEKYQWVNLKRLKAKQKYQNKQYDQAIEIYLQSLIGIDLKDTTQGRLQQMRDQLQLPTTLNIVTCLYMKNQYKKALALCDKLIGENPNYLPAIYKKSYLLKCIGYYIQAKQSINQGIRIAKDKKQQKLLTNFIQLNGQVMKAAKSSDYQLKNIYVKMFPSENSEQETQQSQRESSKLIENKSRKDENQQEILYYEDEPTNICGKIHRKVKNVFFCLFPSLNPQKKGKKKLIHHSKSF